MKKNCVICGREFQSHDRPKRQHQSSKRPFRAKTCSHECSRVYTRLRSNRKKTYMKYINIHIHHILSILLIVTISGLYPKAQAGYF